MTVLAIIINGWMLSSICGCSSGVERYLAKVKVEGSNPFTRSIFLVDSFNGSVLALKIMKLSKWSNLVCESTDLSRA